MEGKCLGKLAPRIDPRTFRLERYLLDTLPVPPPMAYYQCHVAKWPMYLNDTLGDCVVAASGHMIEQWLAYAIGVAAIPTNADILKAYEVVGGYVLGDPSTDNGCDMLTALNVWRKSGIGRHKIMGYASILDEVEFNISTQATAEKLKLSIKLFGNAYLGLALPLSAQTQDGWHIDDTEEFAAVPGSWGGHCVPAVGYDAESITVVTWGGLLNMSWNFFFRYCDEAYAVLSKDWIEATGSAPSGFDFNTLEEDLQEL